MKLRHIASERQNDPDGIVSAAIGVVALQGAAQTHRLNADDRIVLRIEIVAAAKRFDGDRVTLDAILPAAQRGFDHIAQERDELRRGTERFAHGDAVERSAYLFRRGTFLVPGIRVGHCLPLCRSPESPFGIDERSAVTGSRSTPIVTTLPYAGCNRILTDLHHTIFNL